jgi:hypothetical protein
MNPNGYTHPPLVNVPPQIFGNYTHDGQLIPANLPDMTGPMFPDPGLLDDSNEAKRRRIARVCQLDFT